MLYKRTGIRGAFSYEGLFTYLSQSDHLRLAMQGMTHSITVESENITATVLLV